MGCRHLQAETYLTDRLRVFAASMAIWSVACGGMLQGVPYAVRCRALKNHAGLMDWRGR